MTERRHTADYIGIKFQSWEKISGLLRRFGDLQFCKLLFLASDLDWMLGKKKKKKRVSRTIPGVLSMINRLVILKHPENISILIKNESN